MHCTLRTQKMKAFVSRFRYDTLVKLSLEVWLDIYVFRFGPEDCCQLPEGRPRLGLVAPAAQHQLVHTLGTLLWSGKPLVPLQQSNHLKYNTVCFRFISNMDTPITKPQTHT